MNTPDTPMSSWVMFLYPRESSFRPAILVGPQVATMSGYRDYCELPEESVVSSFSV